MTSSWPIDWEQPVERVAPQLLGCHLAALSADGLVVIRISEVEAYAGADDPASHAWRGQTVRNQPMFGPPAHLYVYLAYGLHQLVNITCQPIGSPAAVLIRAGQVVAGQALASQRSGGRQRLDWGRGPGCVGQIMGLGLADSGLPLGGKVWLKPAEAVGPIAVGERIGIRRAQERPWRFWLANDLTVSAKRRPKHQHRLVNPPD
jgi:DNA-3-methyladenine glycosylase